MTVLDVFNAWTIFVIVFVLNVSTIASMCDNAMPNWMTFVLVSSVQNHTLASLEIFTIFSRKANTYNLAEPITKTLLIEVDQDKPLSHSRRCF